MSSSSHRLPERTLPAYTAASGAEARSAWEPWFQALVENTSDALALLGTDGTILYANPALERILGAAPGTLAGTCAFSWIHPDDRARSRELFQADVEGHGSGEPFSTPYRVQAGGGELRWLESTVVNRLDNPSIGGLLVSTRDVTARVRLEARNSAFQSLGQQLNRTTTPREAAQVIFDVADQLLGWDACWLELHDPEGGPAHVVLMFDEVDGERRSIPPPAREMRMTPLTERAIRDGSVLILRTPDEVPDWKYRFGDTGRLSASILCVPIHSGSEFVGAISIQSYRFNAYSEEDTATLQALADYCAGALQRTQAETARRLLQEQLVRAQQQEAEALREQARLATIREEIGTALAQNADLPSVLRAALQPLVRHLPVALARIWTLDPGSEHLEMQASAGLYPDVSGPRQRVRLGESELGAMVVSRQPILDNALHASPIHAEWAGQEGLKAEAGYPLRTEGGVVGALLVFSAAPISAEAFATLGVVAERLAQFIESYRNRHALEEMQTRFAAFMHHSPALAAMRDETGRYVYVNRQFEEAHGVTLAQVYGKTMEEVFPPEAAAQFQANQQEMLRQGKPLEFLETVTLADGRPHDFHAIKFPIRDAQGRSYVGVISTDVTEHRVLEAQLRQAQKLEAVGRLAGGVAHDFNNMLAVINGYTLLLLKDPTLSEATRTGLEEVLHAGERAAALTSQLLAFSRRQLIQPQILDLGEIVTRVSRMLHRLIGEDIELVISMDAAGAVKADPSQLEQVLVNLVVNARDAMPDGGRITLDVRGVHLSGKHTRDGAPLPPGRYVCLTVRDAGCGMEPDTLAHVFEPFYTTKPLGKGTGLGLATVYGVVKQNHGHIEVESEIGQGTTFRLYFPTCSVATG